MKTKKPKKDEKPHKELWGDAEMEDILFEDDESESLYFAEQVLMFPFMNYNDDPKRFYRRFKDSIDMEPLGDLFAPFLQYCMGVFSLKGAREQFLLIFTKESLEMALYWHRNQSEGVFKIWNGREFAEAMKDLNGEDKEKIKQAAIEIVRVFKDADETHPIINKLMTKAEDYGDHDFLRKIEDAKREIWIDAEGNPTFPIREHYKKRPERYLFFKLLGEDFIRDHTDNEIADILNRNLDSESKEYVYGEVVKEYRHQLGIRKKEGPGAPRKRPNQQPSIDMEDMHRKIEETLESHKEDFKWYLWGDKGLEGFKKHLRKLKYGP